MHACFKKMLVMRESVIITLLMYCIIIIIKFLRLQLCIVPVGAAAAAGAAATFICLFKEIYELTHLDDDLLSIPRSAGKMSERLGAGIIGCKDKTSLWRLIGFPNNGTYL